MSEIFHKSCYTSRSSGYKYRTLSTNTGDKKRRECREDSTFDRKFKELQREIACRIDKQLSSSQKARKSVKEKIEMIDSKVNVMLELQETVASLKQSLVVVGNTLVDLAQKVELIDAASLASDAVTLRSGKSSFRSQAPIEDSDEEIRNVNL